MTQIAFGSAELPEMQEKYIPCEDCIVTLNTTGCIKRMPPRVFLSRPEDADEMLTQVIETKTDRHLRCFSDLGQCYTIDVLNIPEAKWKEKGAHIASIFAGLEKDECFVSLLDITDLPTESCLDFYTHTGMVKRTRVNEYSTKTKRIAACGLNDNDRVIAVAPTDPSASILMVTRNGMSIQFQPKEVSEMGRAAKGVHGINLEPDDCVIYAAQTYPEGEVVVITDRGYAKRSFIFDYELQKRNGKGLKTIDFKKNASNGQIVAAAFYVRMPFDIEVMQAHGDKTIVNTEEIMIQPRFSKGMPIVMALMDNVVETAIRV